MRYEPVIGLEVHVQLRTATKLFCRCPNRFGAAPNTLVCPICLGYPGTLPVVNRRAVDLAIVLALALGATVQATSRFARKSYFYADLPKGYQISQFELPLAIGGRLPLARHRRSVELQRLHLEEDAGKLLHDPPTERTAAGEGKDWSWIDFNRCGVPLVEIVSAPSLRSPQEAGDYLRSLHRVLLYTETSDANLQEGSLRCDANVSIRPTGSRNLGTRTEIKNLNSFRHLRHALEFEIERQSKVVAAGGQVRAETRSYDARAGITRTLRDKEETHDYRYFPEPDLPPLGVSRARVESLAATLPELPGELVARLRNDYRLPLEDVLTLTSTPALARYSEAALGACPENPRAVANWIKTEILRVAGERGVDVGRAVAPRRLAELVRLVDRGGISLSAAKRVLEAMWDHPEEPAVIAERLGLTQISDPSQTVEWIAQVLAENPAQVAEYRAGKTRLLGYFMGQVMRRSGGRANPRAVRSMIRRALDDDRRRAGAP